MESKQQLEICSANRDHIELQIHKVFPESCKMLIFTNSVNRRFNIAHNQNLLNLFTQKFVASNPEQAAVLKFTSLWEPVEV